MLSSRAFSSYVFLSVSLPSDDKTMPSFQATMSPVFCGAFLVAISGLVAIGRWMAIEMNAVVGRGLVTRRG